MGLQRGMFAEGPRALLSQRPTPSAFMLVPSNSHEQVSVFLPPVPVGSLYKLEAITAGSALFYLTSIG